MDIGTEIEGRYVVERTLASGGMATVHVVRHLALDSLYALKILHIPSPEIRERLLLEGRLQARLRHPNIVAVTDTLTIEGAPGLIMEFVDGPALDEWLGQHRPSLDEAEALFLGVLAAVDHAHRHGVVHRDLKPANVLLAPMAGGFLPKVADFGIAKVVEDVLGAKGGGRVKTRTGVAMGTPAYMAPEQIDGASSVGPKADIFALGCILYDLIVGRPAFDGPTLLSVLTASREGFYDDPAEAVPGLPDRFVQAIRGALAPEAEDRIADCTTLAQVLTGGRVATLSGTGPVLASQPIALPDSRYPRGLGSNPRRSHETFRPEDLAEPDEPEPPAPRGASAAPVPTPVVASTLAPAPDDAPGGRWAPRTHPEIRDARDRRRNGKLIALWFVIATGVIGVLAVVAVLAVVGVAGVAWVGMGGVGTGTSPDVPVVGQGAGSTVDPTIVVPDPPPDADPAPDPVAPPDGVSPTRPYRPPSDDGVAAVTPDPLQKDPPPAGPSTEPAEPDPVRPPDGGVAVVAPDPTPDPTPDPVPKPVEPVSPPEPADVGSSGPWRLVVRQVRTASESRSGVFSHRAASGNHLLLLDVVIDNRSGRTTEPKAPFRLRAKGKTFEVNGACRLALPGSFSLVPDLRDGQQTTGSLCFEVPSSVRGGVLSFAPGSGQPVVEVRF